MPYLGNVQHLSDKSQFACINISTTLQNYLFAACTILEFVSNLTAVNLFTIMICFPGRSRKRFYGRSHVL